MRARTPTVAARRARWATGLAIAFVAGSSAAQQFARVAERAEDQIAPFRFTGYDGYVLMNFLRDATESSTPAAAGTSGPAVSQTISQWRTEFFLNGHAYVFLPVFLTLDLGGGPVVDYSSYEADDTKSKSTKDLYNLTFRATALRDKPYTGTVFYEHLNPTQNVGPSQVLFTESDRYGMNLSWLSPSTPVPLYFEATRHENRGRGTDQTLDDRIDLVSLRADTRVGTWGHSRIRLQSTAQDSRSGSTGLPIQASSSRTDAFDTDTRLRFGTSGEYDLTNTINAFRQDYTLSQGAPSDVRNVRFDLYLRRHHSDELQSFARYALSDDRTNDQKTAIHAFSAGATARQGPDIYGNVDANASLARTTQFDADAAALTAAGTYGKKLGVGEASVSYSVSAGVRDQTASADTAAAVGERLVLAGTAPVPLKQQQVIAGSVTVVNATRTQVFVEGVDYVLSVVGLVTRVERLASGSIVDGQEVLADYEFQVGGTFVIRRIDQSASLTWNYRSDLSVYVRLLDSRPRLQSGQPTFEINPVRDTTYGARADVPVPLLPDGFTVGGYVEREDRREVISPGERMSYEVYAQAPLPYFDHGGLRIGTRRSSVDYDLNPEQAVRLTAYDMRVWTRPLFGLDFSIEATRERDTGTAVLRERTYVAAKAQWRVRQFRLNFDFSRTDETQGDYRRRRNYAQLVLRRDF